MQVVTGVIADVLSECCSGEVVGALTDHLYLVSQCVACGKQCDLKPKTLGISVKDTVGVDESIEASN